MADERKNIVLHGELTNRENIFRYRKMDCCEYMLDDISIDQEKIRNTIVIHAIGFLLAGLAYFANIPVAFRDSFLTNGTPARLWLIIIGFIIVIVGTAYLTDKCQSVYEAFFLGFVEFVCLAFLYYKLVSWVNVHNPGLALLLFAAVSGFGKHGEGSEDRGPHWAYSTRFGSFFFY